MENKLKFNDLVENLRNQILDMDSTLSEQEFNDLLDESGFGEMVDSVYSMMDISLNDNEVDDYEF